MKSNKQKRRNKAGFCDIFGYHAVYAALKNPKRKHKKLFLNKNQRISLGGEILKFVPEINELKNNDRIIFTYDDNPNGSALNIAGITNAKRNVLGMMPHPERASDDLLSSIDGRLIFESILS